MNAKSLEKKKKIDRSISFSLILWYVSLISLINLLLNKNNLNFSELQYKFIFITLLIGVFGLPFIILYDYKKLKKITQA